MSVATGSIMMSALIATMLHVVPAQAPCDSSAWARAFRSVLAQHPRAGLADLYKFTHQGVRGGEHAVGDGAGAAAWMNGEVRALDTLPATVREPLIESLPPDGRFVRVHLRPFLAAGGAPARLLDAFVATANTPASAAARIEAEFTCAERGIEAVLLPSGVSRAAIAQYFAARRAAGWDAVHHSPAYERAYRPAYRVVAKERAAGLWHD